MVIKICLGKCFSQKIITSIASVFGRLLISIIIIMANIICDPFRLYLQKIAQYSQKRKESDLIKVAQTQVLSCGIHFIKKFSYC